MTVLSQHVLGTHAVPRAVVELLQQPGIVDTCQAGISSSNGFCWVLCGQMLWMWQYSDARDSRLRMLRLPPAVTSGAQKHHVAILSHAGSNATTVIVCSDHGYMCVWLDANYLAEPIIHQLSSAQNANRVPGQAVVAFAAATSDLSTGPGFVAAFAGADGSWHLAQGSAQGIFTKQVAAPAAQQEAKGVLGTLGSVISYAYAEAFDPSSKYVKRSASGKTPLALHMTTVDAQHLQVLLLTEQTLECWRVTLGVRPNEQLLWSFHNVLAVQHERRLHAPANVQLAVTATGHAYVWIVDHRRDGSEQHLIHRLVVNADSCPVHDYCALLEGLDQPLSAQQVAGCSIVADAQQDAALLQLPDRSLYEWTSGVAAAGPKPAAAPVQQLQGRTLLASEDTDIMAVAAAAAARPAGAAAWLVFSSTYGVMEAALMGAPSGTTAAAAAAAPSTQLLLQPALPVPAAPTPPAAAAAEDSPAAAAAAVAAAAAAAAVGTPLSHAAEQQVHALLDSVVMQAAALNASQQPLLGLVAGLRRRLESVGALVPISNQEVFAKYSTGLVDMLPKQWALGGGASAAAAPSAAAGGAAASLLEALAEKESKHSLLLACLGEGGVLHGLAPAVVKVLVENAEKLAVCRSVMELHARAAEAHAANGGLGEPLISQVVQHAGQLSSTSSYETLRAAEVFYARPSTSVTNLLQALGQAADALAAQASSGLARPGDEGVRALRVHVEDLGAAVGAVVGAAHARRDLLQQAHRLVVADVYGRLGQPGWLADSSARAAFKQVVQACQAVRAHLTPAPSSLPTLSHTLFGVTEVLLSAFAAAVAAASTPAAKAPLVSEYQGVRGGCVEVLLEDAVGELAGGGLLQGAPGARRADAAGGVSLGGQLPPPEALVWQVEELCRAHHCYPQLFDVCELLATADPQPPQQGPPHRVHLTATSPRLHRHMAAMTAEDGAPAGNTFAWYVFQRLLDDGRHADLLQLPPDFHPRLADFLQRHPQLLWLHQLRTGEMGGAAATLAQEAEAARNNFGSYRRLLCLSKLSALAAQDAPAVGASSTALALLAVQYRLGLQGGALQPTALVDAALQLAQQQQATAAAGGADADAAATAGAAAEQGVLGAVEVLSLCAASDREANRSRWKLAWKLALGCTDWRALDGEVTAAVASGDEAAGIAAMQCTALYRGASLCCGSGAFGFGASVCDTAPVEEVQGWLQEWTTGDEAAQALVVRTFELALHDYATSAAATSLQQQGAEPMAL